MAALYDTVMGGAEQACLRSWRAALIGEASGRVLEIGAGTGASMAFYGDAVTHLIAAEPDRHMRRRLLAGVPAELPFGFESSSATADALPFDAGSFDTVVSTLVLCSVGSLQGSLREIFRVLEPGGQLLFLEHVAAEQRPGRLKWQRRIEPLWRRVAGNCHLTRQTEQAIIDAGFCIERVERESIRKAMALARPSVRGVARKPRST